MMKPALLIAALGLSACAAATGPQLSASQCATDWGSVGYADGLDGAPEGKIDQYQRACAGSGPLTTADIDAWQRGWADAVGVSQDQVVAFDDDEYEYKSDRRRGSGYDRSIIRPRIGLGLGIGSGGVRGGVGVGFGVGIFNFGLGLGF